ncbi:MAG: aminotransferase class V-fold PLP-dependent enzyme [Pseudomonadota bacterium]
MTGLDGRRVYLDWNATAPLRPEARAAMLEAMDAVGNPSSVHAEGRAARAIVEKARGQVAALVGCEPQEIIFTSGATEANTLAIESQRGRLPYLYQETGHPSLVTAPREMIGDQFWDGGAVAPSAVATTPCAAFAEVAAKVLVPGRTTLFTVDGKEHLEQARFICLLSAACGESGVLDDHRGIEGLEGREIEHAEFGRYRLAPLLYVDATQTIGRIADTRPGLASLGCSAHKLGGPKGVGAFVERHLRLGGPALLLGGGQELGRRSGTENVVGIAGFGAAAEAARRDLEGGVWEGVEKLRNILEETLAAHASDTIFIGQGAPRLPNTSCFAVPGWKGETQVMQMDLAGFAVSAGSACSSGKVGPSRVLRAMGFDEVTASSALRVSLGPTTTEAEVRAFADTWLAAHRRWKTRAA